VSAPKFALIYLKTNFDAPMPLGLRTSAANSPLGQDMDQIAAFYDAILIQILRAVTLPAGSPSRQQHCEVLATDTAIAVNVGD